MKKKFKMDVIKEIQTINTMIEKLGNEKITCFFKDLLVEYQQINDKFMCDKKKIELNKILENIPKGG